MTPFHLFIIALCAFGLIVALILLSRDDSWEVGHSETGKQLAIDTLNRDMDKAASEFEATQERERQRKELDKANIERYLDEQAAIELERLRDRQDRERQEITQKLDTDALEASLQDEEYNHAVLGDSLTWENLSHEQRAHRLWRGWAQKKEDSWIANARNYANWRIGLNSGSRERIDGNEE